MDELMDNYIYKDHYGDRIFAMAAVGKRYYCALTTDARFVQRPRWRSRVIYAIGGDEPRFFRTYPIRRPIHRAHGKTIKALIRVCMTFMEQEEDPQAGVQLVITLGKLQEILKEKGLR